MTLNKRFADPIPSLRRVFGGLVLQGGTFVFVSFLGMGIWLTMASFSQNSQSVLHDLVLINGLLIAAAAWISVALTLRFFGWSWRHIGWQGKRVESFLRSVFWAVLAWLGITALLHWGGGVAWTRTATSGRSLLSAALGLLFGAWGEEIVFRGFWFTVLASRFSPLVAVLISALAFALLHSFNPGWSLSAGIGVFLAGVVLALARHRTQGLAWPIGFHWGWNMMQGLVLGFPVSGLPLQAPWQGTAHGPTWWTGGTFGPEAGLASWLILGLIGLFLAKWKHPWLSQDKEAQ